MNFNQLHILVICTFFVLTKAHAQEVKHTEVSGVYKEKNLYFYTPTCRDAIDNPTVKVLFEGQKILETKKPKAFEVDLSKMGLMYGDEITVKLEFTGCKPFMVNDEAIEKRNSFKIADLNVSDTGVVSFKTYNEVDKFPLIVQQFKWNKWVEVSRVNGEGGENWKAYSSKAPIISGENKFRVIRYNLWKPLTISEEFVFNPGKSKPSAEFIKKVKQVEFSSATDFKVINEYGETIMEGFDDFINLAEFEKGNYVVAYDNTFLNVSL